jgi:hypothetical protein
MPEGNALRLSRIYSFNWSEVAITENGSALAKGVVEITP